MEIFSTKIPRSISGQLFNELLAQLDTDKQTKIQEMKNYHSALEALVSDLFIRHIIRKKLSLTNKHIRFKLNKFGKPRLIGFPAFHFNISHSSNYLVCAIDNKPVGIDVEKITKDNNDLPLDFLSSLEKKAYAKTPTQQQPRFFFQIWTRKESLLKALGQSLTESLRKTTLLPNKQHPFILPCNANAEFKKIYIKDYLLNPAYALAVCAKHQNFPLKIIPLHNRKILMPISCKQKIL